MTPLPGNHLLRTARAWFDDETVAIVFEPLIADWQHECLEHPPARRLVCRIRVYAAFVRAFLASLPAQLRRKVPERVLVTGVVAAEAFLAAGVLVQMYALFGRYDRNLLPAAGALASAAALVPAAIVIARYGRAQARELRSMTMRLACFYTLQMVAVLIWLPSANQAYREGMRPGEYLPRGTREMTAIELLREQPPADAYREIRGAWETSRRRALQERASILVLPLTAGALGVASASVTAGPIAAILWWLAAGSLMVGTFDYSPWLAHALLLALAAGARRARQGPARHLANW